MVNEKLDKQALAALNQNLLPDTAKLPAPSIEQIPKTIIAPPAKEAIDVPIFPTDAPASI